MCNMSTRNSDKIYCVLMDDNRVVVFSLDKDHWHLMWSQEKCPTRWSWSGAIVNDNNIYFCLIVNHINYLLLHRERFVENQPTASPVNRVGSWQSDLAGNEKLSLPERNVLLYIKYYWLGILEFIHKFLAEGVNIRRSHNILIEYFGLINKIKKVKINI